MSTSSRNRARGPQPAHDENGASLNHAVVWVTVIETVGSVFRWGFVCATVGFAAYCLSRAVIETAGVSTTINVLLQLIVDLKVVVSWAVTAGAVGYGVLSRRKLLRERKDKDDRIAKLERMIDPGRTSSEVTVEGKPRRESK